MDFEVLLQICQQFSKKFEKEQPKTFEHCVQFIEQSLIEFQALLEDYDELQERNEKYEKMLQKHENEIRDHIRINQQLKLHLESLQQKYDDQIKQNEKQVNKHEQSIATLQKQKLILERKIQEKEEFVQDLQLKYKQNNQTEFYFTGDKFPKQAKEDFAKKKLCRCKKLKLQSIDNTEIIKKAFQQFQNSVKTERNISVEKMKLANQNFNNQVINSSSSQQPPQNLTSKNHRNNQKKKVYGYFRNSKILIKQSIDFSKHFKKLNQSAMIDQRILVNKNENDLSVNFQIECL